MRAAVDIGSRQRDARFGCGVTSKGYDPWQVEQGNRRRVRYRVELRSREGKYVRVSTYSRTLFGTLKY